MIRTAEHEARRLEAIRSAASRKKMSDAKKGKTPTNFAAAQKKAWAASRKDVLTYSGIHAWVRRTWGRAHGCELCGKTNLTGRKVHWANKDHKYTRKRSDWMMMCRPCHAHWDMEHGHVSFGSKRTVTHCPRGHEYTPDNTRTYHGCRHCMACNRERARERRARKNQ